MNLQQTFGRTLKELHKVVPYDRASILALRSDHLEFVGGAGWPNLSDLIGMRIDLPANGFQRALFDQKKPLIIDDSCDQAIFRTGPLSGSKSRAQLLVPLLLEQRVSGLLCLDKQMPGFYIEEHADQTSPYAAQATIAIEATRYYQLEQQKLRKAVQRRRIAECLGDIIVRLNSDQALNDILAYIATQANQLLQTDACAVYRREVDGTHTCLALQGRMAETLTQTDQTLEQGAFEQVVISRRPATVSNVPEDVAAEAGQPVPTRDQAALAELTTNYRTLLALPLIIKGATYGSLVVYYGQHRFFSAEEMELASIFSNQVAMAIENARLKMQAEQAAVVAERIRMARELHDAVVQILFSANALAETIPRLWDRYPEQGRRGLNSLRQMTWAALAEMRNLLLELRPAALTEKKLVDLLRQLADAMQVRAQMTVTFTVVGVDRSLPAGVQVTLYRIAQEALNNAVKYARASRIAILLEYLPHQVVLQIRDNGQGFDPETILPDQLGIEIMRERAQESQASFSLNSQPSQGTELIVKWPEQ